MWAFLFPGQGSQQVGMGQFLFQKFPLVQKLFEEASDVLSLDFKKLCFTESEQELSLTENTQPCLLLISTATAQVLESELGIIPSVSAGHSVGEYAALVAAHVLRFSDALLAVRKRGEWMQSAVPVGEGGMCAVLGLSESQVDEICRFSVDKSGTGPLSPANYNSPGQIVISGSQLTLKWLYESFKVNELWPDYPMKKIKIIPLQVSAPFHCEMMKPAEDKMRSFLSTIVFSGPRFPIIQNYTAQMTENSLELKENLIRQISSPVKWIQSMETLKNNGFQQCIEAGHGRVLQGLMKKIDGAFFQTYSSQTEEDFTLLRNIIHAFKQTNKEISP